MSDAYKCLLNESHLRIFFIYIFGLVSFSLLFYHLNLDVGFFNVFH